MALNLHELQPEIQDLVARVARLEAKYRAGGITAVERDNKLRSQDAEATKAFWGVKKRWLHV